MALLADPMEVQQLQMGVHPEQMPGGAMNPQDPNMGQARNRTWHRW